MPTVLVVGLGNPGAKYDQTRHNVGWMLVERLAERFGVELVENAALRGCYGEVEVQGSRLALLKPLTFMNLSGQAAAPAMAGLGIEIDSVLCAVDEIQLDCGRLKLSSGGSDGGHNGLTSMIAELGDDGFRRLRIGIGPYRRDAHADGLKGYVLSRFKEHEREVLEETLALGCAAVEEWISQGADAAAYVKATAFANAKSRQPLLLAEKLRAKQKEKTPEEAKVMENTPEPSLEPALEKAATPTGKGLLGWIRALFGGGAKGPQE